MNAPAAVANWHNVSSSAWDRWKPAGQMLFNTRLQFFRDRGRNVPTAAWNVAFFAACELSDLRVDFLNEARE